MRFFTRKPQTTDNPTPRLYGGELRLDISQQEILQDLFWPGPPPGSWNLEPEPSRPVTLPVADATADWRDELESAA